MTVTCQVKLTYRRQTPVIVMGGECDVSTLPEIKAAVDEALTGGATSLVFDLEDVTFLDSAVLGAFLNAHRRVAGAGGNVTLLASSERLVRILLMAGMDRICNVTSRSLGERAASDF